MTQHWYVVKTKPHYDAISARALKQNDFEYLFPYFLVPKRDGSQGKSPLFPGYLFVRCDLDAGMLLSSLPGINGFVEFGGVVPSIPDEIVANLKKRIEETNSSGGLWVKYRPGDTVRVTSAKMGTIAHILEEPKSANSRVRVLMEFMGELIPTQVPWRHLKPCDFYSNLEAKTKVPRRTRGRGRWIQKPNTLPAHIA